MDKGKEGLFWGFYGFSGSGLLSTRKDQKASTLRMTVIFSIILISPAG
jgi:hypothetical protein